MILKPIPPSYVRNFVFGVEDSLVSTVGLLSGIAVADVERKTIFLTGLILICVEAFSMAVGSFLSERSAEGYITQSESSTRLPLHGGVIMFFSYFFSGFIPLFPYVFIPGNFAFWISIGLSLLALWLLGVVGAKISGINLWRNAFRMALIGGMAIAVGVLVGQLVNNF